MYLQIKTQDWNAFSLSPLMQLLSLQSLQVMIEGETVWELGKRFSWHYILVHLNKTNFYSKHWRFTMTEMRVDFILTCMRIVFAQLSYFKVGFSTLIISQIAFLYQDVTCYFFHVFTGLTITAVYFCFSLSLLCPKCTKMSHLPPFGG